MLKILIVKNIQPQKPGRLSYAFFKLRSGCCECVRGKTNAMGFCVGTKSTDVDQQCECTLECDQFGTNCDISCPNSCGNVDMSGYAPGWDVCEGRIVRKTRYRL